MENHPSARAIWRLLVGEERDPEVRGRVTRHLVKGCPVCTRHMKAVLADPTPEERPGACEHSFAYDETIDNAWEKAQAQASGLKQEARFLPRALAALERNPDKDFLAALKRHENRAVQGLPRVDLLLAASFRERYRNPKEMLKLAEYARTVSGYLPHTLSRTFRCDVRARVWGELGNAYRVCQRLWEAEKALDKAEKLREGGTGEPLLEARLLELRASLLRDQRKLVDALFTLEKSEKIYREIKDDPAVARVLSKRGQTLDYAGNPREALAAFRQGLTLVDRERDPELATSLTFSLLCSLLDCGEAAEAGKLFMRSGLRRTFEGEPLKLLKLRWLEGRIFAARGDAKAAERVLREVRAEFTERKEHYDAALVAMELVGLWQKQGRAEDIQQIATEAHDTFYRLRIRPEAMKALNVLRICAKLGLADEETVSDVKRFLVRHKDDRELSYDYPPVVRRLLGFA